MTATKAGAIDMARRVTASVTEILPPRAVLSAFRALADAHPALGREVLGHDANGEPIEAYRWGEGSRHVLWYGFPDPGEAVGATGLLALFSALLVGEPALTALDLTWHVIPCLNLVDQPHGGETLAAVVMKTSAQEVDWCVHAPRPETTALLDLATRVAPQWVFPLHDEFHCAEPLPVYAMVTEELTPAECTQIRETIEAFGYEVDTGTMDPLMGAGFAQMRGASDYENSTFFIMAKTALVFICEVSLIPSIPARDMAGAQLAACLAVLLHRLAPSNGQAH